MFRTLKHAEILASPLYGDEAQVWRYVEHSLHNPWFYVTVTEQHSGQSFSSMLLIQDVCVLESLLAAQSEFKEVAEVLLVSPSYMNASGRWMMEPLVELAQINGGESSRYFYLVEGGKRYSDSLDATQHGDVPAPARVVFQRASSLQTDRTS